MVIMEIVKVEIVKIIVILVKNIIVNLKIQVDFHLFTRIENYMDFQIHKDIIKDNYNLEGNKSE